MGNLKSKYPFCAAWFASAAPLLFSAWAHAQAPIIDASEAYGRGGSYSAPAAVPAQASGNMSAELLSQLQALQQEVMQLRGQLEEQGYQLESLRQQSLDRYVDLDRRLSQLQGVPPSAAASGASAPGAAAPGTATPAAPASGTAAPAPAAQAPAAQQPQASAETAAPAPTGAAKPDEQEAYRQAYAKVKSQQFAAAIQSFNAFLADYPNSTLVPNAYYWLGELHLVESPQNLPGAEKAFNTLLKTYPLHNKAPDALYKLGRVEFQKGNKTKSRELLQQVIDDYGSSGSSAPQLAKQFIDENFR